MHSFNIQPLNIQQFKPLILIPLLLLLSACAPGHEQFSSETPAGFWYGLWHGMIAFITLIIHIFDASVMVYEVDNSGGWYDFGFLLGVTCIWGGSSHVTYKSKERKKRDKEWEEIGKKVEAKVKRKLNEWAEEDDETGADKEWEEISGKVEKKLKRKIRDWAEKD